MKEEYPGQFSGLARERRCARAELEFARQELFAQTLSEIRSLPESKEAANG